MQRTASYVVLVSKYGDSYTARVPAFPDLAATESSSRRAYAKLKLAIKARLLTLFATSEPIPRDPVIQTRTLRYDLWYLRDQEDLR